MLKDNQIVFYLSVFFLLILLLVSFSIFQTTSFFIDSTQGENISFKLSEWKPAESKLEIIKDGSIYSIEEKIDSLNSTNQLQNFHTQDNQYLSFQYKIESDEDVLGFDDPNFIVKINDEIVLQDNAASGVWKRGFVNLKNHKSSDDNYSIDFISENTFDEINPPTLIIKEISTSKFLAKNNDELKFSVSKENTKIFIKYSVDESGLEIQREKELTSPYEFLITEHFYDDEIEYYSVDSFGNVEASKFISIYTDFEIPEKIDDINCYSESDSELSATFTSPADSFSNLPAYYEGAISINEITEIDDWYSLEKVTLSNFKKFGASNLPSKSGSNENILFQNLDTEKSFFAIKSSDQAGNYSQISSCLR